jgi:hypothetical protein
MDRLLRARVLVAEAESLGVSLDDLLAAAATSATLADRAEPVSRPSDGPQDECSARPPSRRRVGRGAGRPGSA